MHKSQTVLRCLMGLTGLLLILALVIPANVAADSLDQSSQVMPKCVDCHTQEAESWSGSAHAFALDSAEESLRVACSSEKSFMDCTCLECHTTGYQEETGTFTHSGVTCEACHGPYSDDHPQNGAMFLAGDSIMCQNCHANTHREWQNSPHGQANVQCIGCHQVHSQDLRLENVSLCESCHREQHGDDVVHTVHSSVGIACADCHLPSVQAAHPAAELDVFVSRELAANHGFDTPAAGTCVNCHAQNSSMHPAVDAAAASDRADRLALEFHETQKGARTWQTLSFVTLGAGLGMGGMLGAVFVLAVGFVYRGRSRS